MTINLDALRLADDSDVARLHEIVEAAYETYLTRMDRPPAPMTRDLASQVAAGQVWVVGKPAVGMICLTVDDDAVLVENVAVHPDAQGQGLGRTLMDFAEKHAQELGVQRIWLYTNEVMTENLAIYSHLGYVEIGRKTENGYRRVFMEKTFA